MGGLKWSQPRNLGIWSLDTLAEQFRAVLATEEPTGEDFSE
jgi:hypothetical protein